MFVAILMVGCGEPDVVSGLVTLDGEPLAGAIVQFTPEGSEGRIAVGKTGTDGTYELRTSTSIAGVTPGTYRVTITTGDISDDGTKSKEKVPAKYNKNSDMIKEVKQGENKIDFPLAP